MTQNEARVVVRNTGAAGHVRIWVMHGNRQVGELVAHFNADEQREVSVPISYSALLDSGGCMVYAEAYRQR